MCVCLCFIGLLLFVGCVWLVVFGLCGLDVSCMIDGVWCMIYDSYVYGV